MTTFRWLLSRMVFLAAGSLVLMAQPAQGQGQGAQTQQAPILRPDYLLGTNDQILIRVPQADEVHEKPFRIDADGNITLPIAGKIKAVGLTIQALEAEVARRLREFVQDPQVSISLVQFRSDPAFFVGAFKNPGIYTLTGRRTLIEMLSAIGGLLPNAGRRVRVTRKLEYGKIELPNAVENTEKKTSTVEISLDSLTQDVNPASDIVLQPYDIISVERAERVYVNGEVNKSGAIELGERDTMSVGQALTEAGGFNTTASSHVRILRPVLGTSRRAEINVDMKRVFEGKDPDYPLLPNDLVYVPRSARRGLATPIATGLVTSLPYLIVTLLVR
jgi:polysaccharide export outer membrane protein